MPARKDLQGAFEELRVTDKRLTDALGAIEEYEVAAAPVKEKQAEATRPFRTQLKRLAEEHDLAEQQAVAAEREAAIVTRLAMAGKLFDGAQVRVGAWVFPVKEIETIEKVEHGKGYKLTKPIRVE